MPRYKETNKEQGQFIPIIFEEQMLPGTIEYAICNIIDKHVDTSVFANITVYKGPSRFILRTKKKVNIQWLAGCGVARLRLNWHMVVKRL